MLIDTSPPPQSGRAHSIIATTASDVSDYLEAGSAPLLSHLVINGIHLSMNISAGKEGDLCSGYDDPDHLAFARWECTAATDKLIKPRRPVTSQLEADTIHLDDRSVQRQVDLPGFIDICRPAVLRSNTVYREVTHDGQIRAINRASWSCSTRSDWVHCRDLWWRQYMVSSGQATTPEHSRVFSGYQSRLRCAARASLSEAPRLNAPSANYPSLMRRLQTEAEPRLSPWEGAVGLSWMRSATMIDQSIPAACRLLVSSILTHYHLLNSGTAQNLLTLPPIFLILTWRFPIPGATAFTGGCNE
jgi:hypothetical protein